MTRLLATLAVLSVLLAGGTASAVPITSFGTGGGGALTLTPVPTTGFTTSAGTIGTNTGGATSTDILGAAFSNMTFALQTVPGPGPGPTNGVFNVTSPSVTFDITPTVAQGGGVASFVLLSPFTNTSLVNNFINLEGQIYLQSNTTAFDFGPLLQLWTFNPTVTVAGGVIFASGTPGSITFNPNTSPSPSLSAVATGTFFNLNQIPEPATLAIFGVFGVAGLIGARRKLKKSAEPTVAA